MTCVQTLAGLAKDCSSNIGGLKKVYIAPWDDAIVPTIASGAISSISVPTGTTPFMAFNFRQGAASMTKTLTKDEAAGTYMVQTQVVMNFAKMDTAKRTEVAALSLGEMMVIAVDNNGTAWFLGKDNPVVAIGSQVGQTGQAKTDTNQYSITLQEESGELPYALTDATVYSGIVTEV